MSDADAKPIYMSTKDIADYLTAAGARISERTVREKVIVQPGFPEPFRPSGCRFVGRVWEKDAVMAFLMPQRKRA